MHSLEDYRGIVGEEVIAGIHKKTRSLYGKHIVHVNSTYQGGGVAEILASLVPLMNDIGVDTGWRILHGSPDFFGITKKFHNSLQGDRINFTDIKKELYVQNNEYFSSYTHLDHDCVIVHDPQPLPLIEFYKKSQPWIWRCHVELKDPDPAVFDFLKYFILRYDTAVVSNEKFKKYFPPVDLKIFYPAIDPLSAKNMELPREVMRKYLTKHSLPTDKPIITQVSRFDKWKDPEGVLEVFKLVKEKVDCRLILCGGMATDDPEGDIVFKRVQQKAKDMEDVILMTNLTHLMVNVLQRSSQVIIQKSLVEGFGLTVTEGLWKEKPVVASNVGGIPLQIKDGENGFLFDPQDLEGFANKIVELLKNQDMAREVGRRAKESVRQNFLITRLLTNYLELLDEVINR